MLEVFSPIGGGEYVVNVMNASAAWVGGGGFKSLLKVVLVMGLIHSLLVTAFNLDYRATLRWFLSSTLIYSCLMVPTVTVRVIDRANPSLAPAVVGNVPIGLGMMASFTSQVGDYFTRTAETVFVMPSSLTYNSNGIIYGNRLLAKTQEVTLRDPMMNANLTEYLQQCVNYDILLGFKQVKDLVDAPDLWAAMGPGATNRGQKWISEGAYPQVKTCRDSYTALTGLWQSNFVAEEKPRLAKQLFPNLSQSMATAKLEQDLGQSLGFFVGSSQSVDTVLRQASLSRLFANAQLNFGDPDQDAWSAVRAEVQAKNVQSSTARQAMTWVPMLQVVLTVIFFAMFPVIFPLFLFPNTGLSTLKGYVGGFFYLASWGPIYVILHMILMSRGVAAVKALAPGANVTMANFAGIAAVNDDISSLAGYMLMSVPVLAAALARGAMAVSSNVGSMLQAATSGANEAAVERTVGNYNYGNTNQENVTANNQSANHWDRAPSYVAGASMAQYRDAQGTTFTDFGNGLPIIDNSRGRSNFGMGAVMTSAFTNNLRSSIGWMREEANRFESGQGNTSSEGFRTWHQRTHGTDSRTGFSSGTFSRSSNSQFDATDNTTSIGNDRTQGTFAENRTSHGSRDDHQSRGETSVGVKGTGFVEGSVGLSALGTGGKAGARAEVYAQRQQSWIRNETEYDEASQSSGQSFNSSDFEKRSNSGSSGTRDETSSGSERSIYARGETFSTGLSGTEHSHNEVQEQREYASYLRSEASRREQTLDQVQSGGYSISEDLSNLVQDRYARLQQNHPGLLPDLNDTQVGDPSLLNARRTAVNGIVGDLVNEGAVGPSMIQRLGEARGLSLSGSEDWRPPVIEQKAVPDAELGGLRSGGAETVGIASAAARGGFGLGGGRSSFEAVRLRQGEDAHLPIDGTITSSVGQRNTGIPGASRNHGGVDIAAPRGTPVPAPYSGVVANAGFDRGGGGNFVTIDHGNGLQTKYLHLDARPTLQPGDQVEAGQVLGRVGSSGTASGPHLHYEMRRNGEALDPLRMRLAQSQLVQHSSR